MADKLEAVQAITVKADQCDKLAEVARAPACFEYRAKAQAFREVLVMLTATPDRSDDALAEEEVKAAADRIEQAVGDMLAFPDDPYRALIWDEELDDDRKMTLNEFVLHTYIDSLWPELLRRASEVAARAALKGDGL